MPTPAIDYDVSLPGSATVKFNSDPEVTKILDRSAAARRKRPASTNNPVRADHTRAPGSWSHLGGRLVSENGVVNRYAGSNVWRVSGDLFQGLHPDIPDLSSLDELRGRARIQALQTFTERTQQLNEALSQVKGTASLVTRFSRAFAYGLDDLMQRNWRRIGRNMSKWRELPSEYLGFCYGIAPLGDDVANAVDVLSEKKLRGFEMAVVLKARLSEESEVIGAPRSGPSSLYRAEPRYRETRYADVGYTYSLPAWYFDRLPTIAPFSSAYAMAPYSFALDWVLPIGSWLGALEAAQLNPFFKEGYETVMARRELIDVDWLPTSGVTVDRSSGGLSGSSFNMRRTRLLDAPQALTTPVDFRNTLGLTKVAQGLALLTQVFKRWS